jgi:hypothetical protein
MSFFLGIPSGAGEISGVVYLLVLYRYFFVSEAPHSSFSILFRVLLLCSSETTPEVNSIDSLSGKDRRIIDW